MSCCMYLFLCLSIALSLSFLSCFYLLQICYGFLLILIVVYFLDFSYSDFFPNFCRSSFIVHLPVKCIDHWSCVTVCGLKASSAADSSCCVPSSPLMNTERSLAILLGLLAHYQLRSTALSAEERQYARWLQSEFFAGGLQTLHVQNPYEEEKGESRTPTSCATTPGWFIS